MAVPRVDRRLAAVLAADVVGYSRLIERDEQGTLEYLKVLRKGTIEPILARHEGRIVKLMGDGALVEFPSASEAVHAAIEVQRAVTEHERDRPEDESIRFRIGISLGDVVHEADGDIFGEGVNLAARLEQLAEPGGVCVARGVYEEARHRLPVAFVPMRPQRLKNIAQPVEVWRVRPAGPAPRPRPARFPRRWLPAIAAAVVLLVALVGAGSWYRWSQSPEDGPSHFTGKPSIAVLPFDNLSADPEQGYLADGIVEDIITQLARNKDLKIIARTTSFRAWEWHSPSRAPLGARAADLVVWWAGYGNGRPTGPHHDTPR